MTALDFILQRPTMAAVDEYLCARVLQSKNLVHNRRPMSLTSQEHPQSRQIPQWSSYPSRDRYD